MREREEKEMGNGRKKRGLNGGLSGAMRVRTLRLERACDETMARPTGNKSLPIYYYVLPSLFTET
jgi:hypothetical protein